MKGKIFKTQEVQAILNGSKVMFREVVKNNLLKSCYKIGSYDSFTGKSESEMMPCNHSWAGKRIDMICSDCWKELLAKCPYQVGQKIFCKEGFWAEKKTNKFLCDYFDDMVFQLKKEDVFRRPAQHMKQEHSRLTLMIKEIRVERLGSISEEDIEAEGIKAHDVSGMLHLGYIGERDAFEVVWNATHKKPEEKFEANPFVFVYQFETIK